MEEIELSIRDAWDRIQPKLLANPIELQRRLARRKSALAHPPRAWCLALRASDTRLDRYCCSHPHPHPDPSHSHEITIDKAALWKLCSPVTLAPPGEPIMDVAAKLGTTRGGLLKARVKGVFRTHHIHGPGKPQPMLYTDQPLDPSARDFADPDPIWTWTATYLPCYLPDDHPAQQLTRVPIYQPRGAHHNRDTSELHPEHPLNDPVPSRSRRSLKLPPPEPDSVWYKWKDGLYVGYDWRNPHAAANYFKHEQHKAKSRAAKKERRKLKGAALSLSKGSLEFRGWRWRCPKCERLVNILYLPAPPLGLLKHKLSEVSGQTSASPVESRSAGEFKIAITPSPPHLVTPSSFACEKCHSLRRISRCDPNGWNEVIRYLSGGLLFGREVPRPDWFTPDRKLPYTPRPNRSPSQRRPQIEQLLLSGKSFRQIASELKLVYGTVLWHAQKVYKQHGVRRLPELLRKHGQSPKPKKRHEIRERLERGESVSQIAQEMGISAMCVYNHIYMLRKSGVIPQKSRKTRKTERTERTHGPSDAPLTIQSHN